MLACTLMLALAGPPEASVPPPSSELPNWRSVQEEPATAPKRPKVPSDGSGMITAGSILIASGAAIGIASIAMAVVPGRQAEGALPIAVGPLVGGGTVILVLGLVIRSQFRAKPQIPGAPRTGSGMQFGGLVLMAGGTLTAALSLVDLGTVECGHSGCRDYRPVGAAIGLGLGVAGAALGTGLLIGGSLRKRDYRRWAENRTVQAMQPSFSMGQGGIHLGITGRF